MQASSGISESKHKHLSRLVIPDRLQSKIIKSETHFVQASSGIPESKPKNLLAS
ncbi:MAG: hypothetical protein SGI89_03070 [bacterium]|nr:hypothetical protein [bacterium]